MTPFRHDIAVDYLGMELSSPLIPAASPLGNQVERLREMEHYGAGAVVLPSLFAEPHARPSRHPDCYFEEIVRAKAVLKIPVIASLNAATEQDWAQGAAQIALAGADALELNIYHLSLSPNVSSAQVEQAYIDTVKIVRQAVKIPVTIKLPPFFTNLACMGRELRKAGASGLVFFNRLYHPDFDLLSMGPGYTLRLSNSSENRLPLRWISLLSRQEVGDLAASTGIRTGADVLKMILSGASAVQLCSILLQRGIPWLKKIEQELHEWMDICQIPSLKKARGLLSQGYVENRGEMERDEYRKALQGYARIDAQSWHDEVPGHADLHLPV